MTELEERHVMKTYDLVMIAESTEIIASGWPERLFCPIMPLMVT